MIKKILTKSLINTIIVLMMIGCVVGAFYLGLVTTHWLTDNLLFGLFGGFVSVLFVMFTLFAFVEETAERKRLL